MDYTHRSQNFWNFLFSLFFMVVLAGALWSLHKWSALPQSIPLFDALLCMLATFRITRLVVYDKITRWFRDLFSPGAGPFGTMADLLSCPWCIGIWAALIVLWAYFLFPWAWFIILFLAVAGAGSGVQLGANLLGWRAEYYKRQAE